MIPFIFYITYIYKMFLQEEKIKKYQHNMEHYKFIKLK